MITQIRRSSPTRRSVMLLALILAAVVAFPAPAPAARYRIVAREDPGICDDGQNCWEPTFRHINKGDVIVWKNPAANVRFHDLRAINKRKWNIEKTLYPGDKARRRFRKSGSYRFRCRIHSTIRRVDGRRVCKGMCGRVHVGN